MFLCRATHRSGKSSVASVKIFFRKPVDLGVRSVSISKRLNISMHLSSVLVTGTGQSTTPSWLLWIFIFENYVNQSLDCRYLIGMWPGGRVFMYGMNWSGVLLQLPAPLHGPSLPENIGIGRDIWPLTSGTNEAEPPPILVTDHGLKLIFLHVGQKWLGCMLTASSQSHCEYASQGHWRNAASDDILWKSHFNLFLDFSRMPVYKWHCLETPPQNSHPL